MKLFGRRRRVVDVMEAPACRACGGRENEVLDRHGVTVMAGSVLATSTWPSQRRERILSACPLCGLVTDLGHPALAEDEGDGEGDPGVGELGRHLVEQGSDAGDGAVVVDVVDSAPAWRSSLLDPSMDAVHWFTAGSLARAVRAAGFGVRAIRLLPAGRVHVEAAPRRSTSMAPFGVEEPPDRTLAAIQYHLGRRSQLVDEHRLVLDRNGAAGTVAVWGADRSTVALLDALDAGDRIRAVVDPDPSFRGQRLVGSELPIVGPDDADVVPSVVLVADPADREEAAGHFEAAGRSVQIV